MLRLSLVLVFCLVTSAKDVIERTNTPEQISERTAMITSNGKDLTETNNTQEFINHTETKSSNQRNTTITSNEDISIYNFTENFLSCPKVLLDRKHFLVLSNSSVYVPAYAKVYDPTNYHIHEDKLVICFHLMILNNEFISSSEKVEYNRVSEYLTLIGMSLSVVCLGLHLLIFLLIPEHKTLTRKNTANLSACLFIAYVLFITGIESAKGTDSCPRIAVSLCYFFLASFVWMNAIAFNVWISLNATAARCFRIVSKASESARFWIYFCYSYIVPFIIVSAALLVDANGRDDSFHPVFSDRNCWFGSRNSLIVFFITPYAVLTITSVVFYIFSIYAIITIKNCKGDNELSPMRRFISCLKLGMVTGLPWLIGIVSLLASWTPLWYVFIISTTLQGVYIFVAYDCNRKTWNSIKRQFKTEEKVDSTVTAKSESPRLEDIKVVKLEIKTSDESK